MDTTAYEFLKVELEPDGVLVINFAGSEKLNAVNERGHGELVKIWPDIDHDEEVRVVLLRSSGRAFSAGGTYEMIDRIIECSKPIVSAINGPAVGAGLAAALMADIPVAGRSARIIDGHTTIGVAAGDHAAVIWPLLVGMAKAKYYLMVNEPLDGEEAERIGLVAKVVDDDSLDSYTRDLASQLAARPQEALSWTKHTLNHWLRMAYPIFDASLAYEFLGFHGPDVAEGLAAVKEKRAPRFI